MMTLMFGNLTLSFVKFGTAVQNAAQNPSASSAAALQEAAKGFKNAAAKDATYLVCIGMSHPIHFQYNLLCLAQVLACL